MKQGDTDSESELAFLREEVERLRNKESELLRAEHDLTAALEAAQASRREVEGLLSGARAVLEYKSFEAAARSVFDTCCELTGAVAGYVALLSADGSENELLFLEAGDLPCTVDPSLPMPIRGLRAEAYYSGKAVYENDFPDSRWWAHMPEGHAKLDNVLFAPLNTDGKAVGLLGISNKPGGFTEHDARLAQAFGDLAAMALKNSQMIEKIRSHESELSRTNDLLLEANRELEAFAHTVSHDLQAPLRRIGGFINLALELDLDGIDDKIRYYLSQIKSNSVSMGRMISDILTFSRMSRAEPKRLTVKISRLCKDICDQLRLDEPGRDVEYLIGEDIRVEGDPGLVKIALENLLGNAWKFTRDRERAIIEVGCIEEGDKKVVFISDNGTGFDPEETDDLFQPFRQLHDDRRFMGTGIGLATVRRIIQRHGGKVWAEGEPGRGATFYFTLA